MRTPRPSGELPAGSPASTPPQFDQLERKETALWRITLLLIVLLALAAAGSMWENLASVREKLPGTEALVGGVVLCMVLFAVYVWVKKREVAELRGFIRGMHARGEALPSEQQLERLLAVVAKSQQGYRDLIDSFNDLVFTFSLDGEVLAANRSLAGILDRPFGDVVGRRLDEYVEEPDRAMAQKALPRFLERRNWQGVVRVRLKSGAVRYLDCVLQAIVKQGEVTGVSCLARDVTQQRESEQRFKELFETLQEGVYFTTPEGKFLDANPTLVHMLGRESKEELLDTNVRDLYVDPGARGELMDLLSREGATRNHEITLRKKDGSHIVCLDTSSAIRDSSGKIVRFQGALVDITERRQIEKRLHEEQEFARRLVASFPDLIIVLDREFRYTFVSPNITQLLGFAPEDLLGKVVGERSHPDDSNSMLELARAVLRGETTFGALEYRTRHKDGSWRIFRATASPLYGPTPAPTPENPSPKPEIRGLIASSRDFTEFKRLEQQVIQSEKLAAMGQMIAGVAHELNNPLTAIVGMSDLLRDRSEEGTTRRQLDLVNQQARRAADIVGNLLSFSRPTTAPKGMVNLNDLVQRTLQLHEYALRVNNITIDFLKEPSLPPVLADSNQLMQVFLNLIVNAEQAIRGAQGKGTLRVRLGTTPAEKTAAPSEQMVWVTMQDDGPGIPADVMPRIFDPFFTTKRPGRGTGLGLSICMALVREHGGSIEAMDAPGGGALFKITLPRAATEAKAAAEVKAVKHSAESSNPLDGRRVLVVDDEESIRELVEAGLSARGLQVDCAASGADALKLAAATSYDVVLCDVKMPGLSGDQVLVRMRAQMESAASALPPFIFMTGDLVEGTATELAEQYGARFVQKPFRIADLLPVIVEVLREASKQPRPA